MGRGNCRWAVLALLAAGCGAVAAAPQLPFQSPAIHAGVASCAGSTCHGSERPLEGSAVQQDEYFTWRRKDAHASAYKSLQSERGQRIAANLGLRSAQDAPECLACHSDFAAPGRRGKRFQLSEGVTCEACHGPAENWLGPHISGSSHAQNVAAGLYPLEQPEARAQVCLHCHMGSERKPIDHRLYGAGHPELWFELDFFTLDEPAHFRVDADFRKRKPAFSPLQTWAAGQVVAARFYLEGLGGPGFAKAGLVPELRYFDCNACHHSMLAPRWQPAPGASPGQVRLSTAHLVMLRDLLAVLAPQQQAAWQQGLQELRAATTPAEVQASARKLRQALDGFAPAVIALDPGADDALRLLDRVSQTGLEQVLGDYAAQRQVWAALGAAGRSLQAAQRPEAEAVLAANKDLLKAISDPDGYDPAKAGAALRKLRALLPKAGK
ncbi:MAG TPA: multiheme c-type cytochrome [Solimonas sp.]|nr:multiheme c-type cytochrome [Solimonas sp.]